MYPALNYLKSAAYNVSEPEPLYEIHYNPHSRTMAILGKFVAWDTITSTLDHDDITLDLIKRSCYYAITFDIKNKKFHIDRDRLFIECLKKIHSELRSIIIIMMPKFSARFIKRGFITYQDVDLDPSFYEGLVLLYRYIKPLCTENMDLKDRKDIVHVHNMAYILKKLYLQKNKKLKSRSSL